MVRSLFFFSLYFVLVSCQANRLAECAALCGNRMTLECCECIGCHQGMRFGKRSAAPVKSEKLNDEHEEVVAYEKLPRSSLYVLRRRLSPEEEAAFRITDGYVRY